MKHFIVFIIFLGSAFFGYSQQFSSEVFHKGFFVTVDGDTIKRELKYDLELNILTSKEGQKVQSYSSQKVFYFQIYDHLLDKIRKFYSIPYYVKPNYKLPIFFELIHEGKLSFISRESITLETVNTGSPYWGGAASTKKVVNYDYYFLDREGNIFYYSGKKKDLLLIMLEKSSRIKEFIKKNRLRSDKIKDLIRITQEYNSLIK